MLTGVVVVTAALLALAGCGGGDGASSGDPDPSTSTSAQAAVETFSVLAGEGVPVDLDQLAANIEERLAVAGHEDATAEVAGDRVTVDPGDGPLDRAAIEDLVSTPGRLEMRPVLEVLPPDCEPTVPTGMSEVSTYPELDPDTGEPIACYEIAPSGITNDAIETAEVTRTGGAWLVNVVLTESAIETFDGLTAACFSHDPSCSTGQVAIAVDGIVISAPNRTTPGNERDQVQINGTFDESEATALAAAIDAEPLPTGLEIAG